MGTLAPKAAEQPETYTAQQIQDKLAYWREHLIEHKEGRGHPVLTLTEVRKALDHWLDQANAAQIIASANQAPSSVEQRP